MATNTYYFPNIWVRFILDGIQEELDSEEYETLLEQAGLSRWLERYPPVDMKKVIPFEDFTALWKTIHDRYGIERMEAIALHAGVKSFQEGMFAFRDFWSAVSSVLYRGSFEKKAKMGLEIFARFFNSMSDEVVHVDQDDEHWYWHVTRCPLCWEWHDADQPVCFAIGAALQGAFEWLAPDKTFEIVETHCIAVGDEKCTVRITKKPLSE